jgi:hypothetical protein
MTLFSILIEVIKRKKETVTNCVRLLLSKDINNERESSSVQYVKERKEKKEMFLFVQ